MVKVGGSTPSPCHRVVSLDNPGVSNRYERHTAGSNPVMEYTIPSRGRR